MAPETVHTRWVCELYDTARPVGEIGSSNSVHDDAVKTTGTPTVAPGTAPEQDLLHKAVGGYGDLE